MIRNDGEDDEDEQPPVAGRLNTSTPHHYRLQLWIFNG